MLYHHPRGGKTNWFKIGDDYSDRLWLTLSKKIQVQVVSFITKKRFWKASTSPANKTAAARAARYLIVGMPQTQLAEFTPQQQQLWQSERCRKKHRRISTALVASGGVSDRARAKFANKQIEISNEGVLQEESINSVSSSYCLLRARVEERCEVIQLFIMWPPAKSFCMFNMLHSQAVPQVE